jgi:hypothetical protein
MSELMPEDVFRLHPKIRWAAFSTEAGQVKFCQMRRRVKSYTPEEADRYFMQRGPTIMTVISERLTPSGMAGRLESIILSFEKDSVFLTKLKGGYLAISVDRVDALPTFQEISESIKALSA